MNIKKIIIHLVLIVILLYLPDICYLSGNIPQFIGNTYTVHHIMKTMLAGIGILWLFKEILDNK